MDNNEERLQLRADDCRRIAVFWFCLAENKQRWEEILVSRARFSAEPLRIPEEIVSECWRKITQNQSCFEHVRDALRTMVCPEPPCNRGLTDDQCGLILDLLSSFAGRGKKS